MSSEELIGTLQELASNAGGCLYELELDEFQALRQVVSDLAESLANIDAEMTSRAVLGIAGLLGDVYEI
jgi:hypothetical protein